MERKLLNVKQLSEYISMPVATIYTYVHTGKIPNYCIRRIGRALKFDITEVDKWVTEASGSRASAQGYKQSAH